MEQSHRYYRDGFLSPVPILSAEEAAGHRRRMEVAEAEFGSLHYKVKVHTILRSPFEIATHPQVLDTVEALIGSNILLYNAEYIVKEPGSAAHVSWHQDLTYWGFDSDALVSMWLALAPATEESGCMRMLPGSHRGGLRMHETTKDANNVLYQGQTVRNVSEHDAVLCSLQPGEASFHHGLTLHASMPNCSVERRIGLNVQYIATHMRQLKCENDSALLVRGEDRCNHFKPDIPATVDLDPMALQRQKDLSAQHLDIAGRE